MLISTGMIKSSSGSLTFDTEMLNQWIQYLIEATLKVWELNGSLGGIDYMVENFSGSLMEWKNENSISELLIDGQEFQFDRVSFSSLFEKFNLIDGKIYLQTGDSVNQLKLKFQALACICLEHNSLFTAFHTMVF